MYFLIIAAVLLVYLIFVFLKYLDVQPEWMKETSDEIDKGTKNMNTGITNFFTGVYFDPITWLIMKLVISFLIGFIVILCIYLNMDNNNMLILIFSILIATILILNTLVINKPLLTLQGFLL